ncbi:MAG: hypothetical protein ACXQTG_04315 [Methanoculleaceae archaeon]
MDEAWLVTLTIRMTVKGAETPEEAKRAAWKRVVERLQAGEDIPLKAEARRMRMIDAEEPLFGKRWD